MKSKSITRIPLLLLIINLVVSCDEDHISKKDLLIGPWNSYEVITEQGEPFQHVSVLTNYEHGLFFSKDGTFIGRYYFDGVWSQGGIFGNYQVDHRKILLTFLPGTPDEYKIDLHIVKLDKNHLWFKMKCFSEEPVEYHLERVQE